VRPKEWQVLEILWRRRPNIVSTDTLMTLLYSNQPDDPPIDAVIKVFISRLRGRLEPTPYSIGTLWGTGYKFLEFKDPGSEPVIGGVEDNVPRPPNAEPPPPAPDKYGFRELQIGQSRRIGNARLLTVKIA
jgi:hypothetical protein